MSKRTLLGILVSLAVPLVAGEQGKPITILDALARSRTVMYVGAHPDDENSIDAFLARAVGAGKKTYMVCFTRGENEPGDVGVPKGRAMAAARSQWFLDSAALLGVEPLHLTYVDGPLPVSELERGAIAYWKRDATPEEVIAQWRKIDRDPYEDMVRVIREKQPDLVLTWEPKQGWTGNAEHRTVAWLAERAFRDAANPQVFPQQIRAALQPRQAKWLFWVLRGDGGDVFDPNPMEAVSCDAPGRGGRTACEVKASLLMSYKRHTMRTATPQQLAESEKLAVKWVEAHPEHVQLALEASQE